MKLLKCVGDIDSFHVEDFNALGIGVEIQDFAKPNVLDGDTHERVNQYKEALKGFRYPIAMHGPFIDLKPVSPDKQIQRVTHDKYLKTLMIAKELGVQMLILHSQTNPWINLYDKPFYHAAYREAFENLLEQSGYERMIVLENIFEHHPNQLKALIEGINHPRIRVNLDIGHSQIQNETTLKDWFVGLGEHIHYIHVHWNDRVNDLHLPLGDEGYHELKVLVDTYTEDPFIAIEYNTGDLVQDISRVQTLMKG